MTETKNDQRHINDSTNYRVTQKNNYELKNDRWTKWLRDTQLHAKLERIAKRHRRATETRRATKWRQTDAKQPQEHDLLCACWKLGVLYCPVTCLHPGAYCLIIHPYLRLLHWPHAEKQHSNLFSQYKETIITRYMITWWIISILEKKNTESNRKPAPGHFFFFLYLKLWINTCNYPRRAAFDSEPCS